MIKHELFPVEGPTDSSGGVVSSVIYDQVEVVRYLTMSEGIGTPLLKEHVRHWDYGNINNHK